MFKNRLLKTTSEKVLLPQPVQVTTPNTKISVETATLVQSRLKERLFNTRSKVVNRKIETIEQEHRKKKIDENPSDPESDYDDKRDDPQSVGFQEKFGKVVQLCINRR